MIEFQITIDDRAFTRRTHELARQIPLDWQALVRDTAKNLASDLSGKSAIGKLSARDQKAAIARDVNRAARGLGSDGWKDPEIQKLIANQDWPRLEAKLTYMRSSDPRILRIQAHGLRRFDQSMHRRARRPNGRVPKNHAGPMVVPNDKTKRRYKRAKQSNRGILRAGFYPAGRALGARRGFPGYVTKHGGSFGYYVDGTRSRSPFFIIGNRAPGANNRYFKESFDWWANRRRQTAAIAAKRMIETTARKFNSNQSLAHAYTPQQ